jgi:hypothetical protein
MEEDKIVKKNKEPRHLFVDDSFDEDTSLNV